MYFSILVHCMYTLERSPVTYRLFMYIGRPLNACVNCFITSQTIWPKWDTLFECLHGDLAVNHLLIRIMGRANIEIMRRCQFNVFLELL